MKLRVRKLANEKWIAERRRLFLWTIICVDVLRGGDRNASSMGYVLTTSTDYDHSIRFNEGSLISYEDAIERAKRYASKYGKSIRDTHIEGDTGL